MELVRAGRTPLHLSYGGNVHPAETLDELINALQTTSAGVRERVAADSLGVSLHLHEPLVRELGVPGASERLRQVLAQERLSVVTANVFPQRAFHAPRVKERVYAPDWSSAERADYTLAAAAALICIAAPGPGPLTLSTLPLGHHQRLRTQPDFRAAAALQVARVACGLAELSHSAGRPIQLALEPEPACVLETQADLADWFVRALVPAAAALGIDGKTLRQHIGSCFDCCHAAVMHESTESALQSLAAAGVAIMKVQISAALETDLPQGLAALTRCAEERWLHQTSVRCGHAMFLAEDLERLPPGARGLARTHFHIPVHAEPELPLRSTAEGLPRTLRMLGALPCTHYEVETYSFSVLPRHLAKLSLEESLAAELTAARGWLLESGAPRT